MAIEDLRDINWNNLNSTSTGMIPKYLNDKVFMKLSTYNETAGFYGEEPEYEELAYKIGEILGLNIVEVEVEEALIQYNNKEYKTLVAISPNFNRNGNSISIENFCEINEINSKDLLFDDRFREDLGKIIEYDFLVNNIDRHGRNMEVMNNKIAPIFDNSLSMFSKMPDNALNESLFEVYSANNFIGYPNLLDNLKLINNEIDLNINIDKFYKIIDLWGLKYNKSEKRISFIKKLINFRYNKLRSIFNGNLLKWR